MTSSTLSVRPGINGAKMNSGAPAAAADSGSVGQILTKAETPAKLKRPISSGSGFSPSPAVCNKLRNYELKNKAAAAGSSVTGSGCSENKALTEMQTLSGKIADRKTSVEDVKRDLSKLAALAVPPGLEEQLEATLVKAMVQLVNSALVEKTDERSGSVADAEHNSVEFLTSRYQNMVVSLAQLAEAGNGDDVNSALKSAESALNGIIQGISNQDDRGKLGVVLELTRAVARNRADMLTKEAELSGKFDAAIRKFAAAENKALALQDLAKDLDVSFLLAAGAAPDGTTAPKGLSMARSARPLSGEAEKLRDAVKGEYGRLKESFLSAEGDGEMNAAWDRLGKFGESLQKTAEKLDAIGEEEGNAFAALGSRAEAEMAILKQNAGKAEEYAEKLAEHADKIASNDFKGVVEAEELLAPGRHGDIPAALKNRIEGARSDLNDILRAKRTEYENTHRAEINDVLAGDDLVNACLTINVILDSPLASKIMRNKVLISLDDKLKAHNNRILEPVNEIREKLGNAIQNGMEGKERLGLADKLERLSRSVEQELKAGHAALKSPLAAAGNPAAERIAAILERTVGDLEKFKEQELQETRTAISLLRFTNNIDHKLSPALVLGKGLPGIEKILGACSLDARRLEELRAKMEAGEALTEEEIGLICGQLENILTRGQKEEIPLKDVLASVRGIDTKLKGDERKAAVDDARKTMFNRLKDPNGVYMAALRGAAVFLASKEDAGDLLNRLKETSKNNLSAMTKESNDLDATALTGKAREDALENFGTRRRSLLDRAKKLLTRDDFKTFDKGFREIANKNGKELVLLCIDRIVGNAALATKEGLAKKADLAKQLNTKGFRVLLGKSGHDPEFIMTILRSGDPVDVVSRIRDEATMRETLDGLMLERPELDDLCLRLKMYVASKGKKQRIAYLHAGDRLVRDCKNMLRNCGGLSGKSLKKRDELLKMPADDFLRECLKDRTLGGDFDLFLIQALWLRHCGTTPDKLEKAEDYRNAFREFRKGLPGAYKTQRNLFRQMASGLSSTGAVDDAGKFFAREASHFRQTGFTYGVLKTLGHLLDKSLTDSQSLNRMLGSLDGASGYNAGLVRDNLLASSTGVNGAQGQSLGDAFARSAFTPFTNESLLPTAKDGFLRTLHVKSRKGETDFTNFSEQIAHAAHANPTVAVLNRQTELENYEQGLNDVLAAEEAGKKGGAAGKTKDGNIFFSTGSTVATFVVVLHRILEKSAEGAETAANGERVISEDARAADIAQWLRELDEPKEYNILTMGNTVTSKASPNSAANAEFRELLKAARTASKDYLKVRERISVTQRKIDALNKEIAELKKEIAELEESKKDKNGVPVNDKKLKEINAEITKLQRKIDGANNENDKPSLELQIMRLTHGKSGLYGLEQSLEEKNRALTSSVDALRGCFDKHRLLGRAQARLVFKTLSKSSETTEKKIGHVLDPEGQLIKNPTTGKLIKADVDSCLQKAASLRMKPSRNKAFAKNHPPEYYMRSDLVDTFKKMSGAALLDAFIGSGQPSFADFIAGVKSDPVDPVQLDDFGEKLTTAIRQLAGNEVKPEDVKKVVRYFLLGAATRYERAEGGPDARLARQGEAIADPLHLDMMERKEDAIAVSAGLNRVALETRIGGLHKNQSISFNFSKGVTIGAGVNVPVNAIEGKVKLSVAMKHGLVLERNGEGNLSVYVSRGGSVGVSFGLSALADTLNAEIEAEGSRVAGFRLEFNSDKAGLDFVAAMLAGEAAPVFGNGVKKIETVKEMSAGVGASASFELGSVVDKANIVASIARHGLADTVRNGVDRRRLVDVSLAASVAVNAKRTVDTVGAVVRETLEFAAEAEAGAVVEQHLHDNHAASQGEEWNAATHRDFTVKMERTTKSGVLDSVVMTRSYTFGAESTEDEIRGVLTEYGIGNQDAVDKILIMARDGNNDVTLVLGMTATATGLRAIRETKGDPMAGMNALCDRANYDNTFVNVVVTKQDMTTGGDIIEHEAGDDEDDAPEGGQSATGPIAGVAEKVNALVSEQTDRALDMIPGARQAAQAAGDLANTYDAVLSADASGKVERIFKFQPTPIPPSATVTATATPPPPPTP